MVVVKVTGGEGSNLFIVERVLGSGSGLDDVTLIKLKLNFAGNILLCYVDESLCSLAKRGKPLSFVYDLSKFVAHFLLFTISVAVQDKLFKLLMCFIKNGSAGCFIYAAGLHANHAVFNDIDDTDAVLSAEFVKILYDVRNLLLNAVDGGGNTRFKGDCNVFAFFGSLFGSRSENKKVIEIGLVCGILKFKTFVADVPDVTVTAVGVVCGERKLDAVLLAVFDLGFSRI